MSHFLALTCYSAGGQDEKVYWHPRQREGRGGKVTTASYLKVS
jgi:hypothetical protein